MTQWKYIISVMPNYFKPHIEAKLLINWQIVSVMIEQEMEKIISPVPKTSAYSRIN